MCVCVCVCVVYMYGNLKFSINYSLFSPKSYYAYFNPDKPLP